VEISAKYINEQRARLCGSHAMFPLDMKNYTATKTSSDCSVGLHFSSRYAIMLPFYG